MVRHECEYVELLESRDGAAVVINKESLGLVYSGFAVSTQIWNKRVRFEQSSGDSKGDAVTIEVDVVDVPEGCVCFISEGQDNCYRGRQSGQVIQ